MPSKFASYLLDSKSGGACVVTSRLITTANTAAKTSSVWMHIFNQYFKSQERFTHFTMTDVTPKVAGRKFPIVTYYTDKKAELPRRVMLVEAMDVSNATWDIKASDAYAVLKGLDTAQSAHKALGVLSSGSEFVLFEVAGGQNPEPKILLGNSTARASLLDGQASLSLEGHIKTIRDEAKGGKCKTFTPPPDPAPVATSTAQVKKASPAPSPKNSAPNTRSSSPVPKPGSSTTKVVAANKKAASAGGNGGKTVAPRK